MSLPAPATALAIEHALLPAAHDARTIMWSLEANDTCRLPETDGDDTYRLPKMSWR